MKRWIVFLLCLLLLTGCARHSLPPDVEVPKEGSGSSGAWNQSNTGQKPSAAPPQESPPPAAESSSGKPDSAPPADPKQPYPLRFGDLLDQDYEVSALTKSLDGRAVTMTGFMAMQSPLDGSFVYLTNLPLVVCPYCAPETDTPIFTMAVYPANGKPIEFTTDTVTVTGTLAVAETANEFGHITPFHLVATSIKPSGQTQLSAPLREYSVLANEGITIEVLNMIDALLAITAYYVPIYEQSTLKLTPVAEIDRVISKVKNYNFSIGGGLLDVLNRLHDLQSKVNQMVGAGQVEETVIYAEDCLQLWEDYLLWGGSITEME